MIEIKTKVGIFLFESGSSNTKHSVQATTVFPAIESVAWGLDWGRKSYLRHHLRWTTQLAHMRQLA